jgi:hypothetical protein
VRKLAFAILSAGGKHPVLYLDVMDAATVMNKNPGVELHLHPTAGEP